MLTSLDSGTGTRFETCKIVDEQADFLTANQDITGIAGKKELSVSINFYQSDGYSCFLFE